jgi:hypothetical protein
MIVATTSMPAALHDWREQTKYQIIGATLAASGHPGDAVPDRPAAEPGSTARPNGSWRKNRQHLDTAINNMTQGLLLFDAYGQAGRLQSALHRHVRPIRQRS